MGLSPSMAATLPGGSYPLTPPTGVGPKTTIRGFRRTRDFRIGLCPLRSPLLGTSLLVSLPPASDMLKFAG